MKAIKFYKFRDNAVDRQVEELTRATVRPTPEYADNTAALAGGLKVGARYHTSAGVVMEVV